MGLIVANAVMASTQIDIAVPTGIGRCSCQMCAGAWL